MTERRRESLILPHPAGRALKGHWSWTGPGTDWAVLWVHGFGSFRDGEKSQALEQACARRGWTFAAFDFRGHGQTGGTTLDLRGSGLLEDLEVIRLALAERGVRRLCPVGSSMGGWAAAWFTLRHPELVPACVLLAPALDFLRSRWDGLTEEERRAWKKTGRLRVRNEWVDKYIGYGLVEEMDQFPLERLLAGLTRPLLVFHGLRDNVLPHTLSLDLLERVACPDVELRLFKNGDHRLTEFKDQIAESACGFFSRLLSLAP